MTRIELIQNICRKIGAERYLEVGIREGEVISQIPVKEKVGVDPRPLLDRLDEELMPGLDGLRVFPCKSDDFFAKNTETFDVVFVDGLHLYEQAIKDILNAFNCLNHGGFVVVHDLLPASAAEGARKVKPGAWNGDVWKVMHDIKENYPEIQHVVLDDDFGVGVLWLKDSERRFEPTWQKGYPRMPFSVFESERSSFMNVAGSDWESVESQLPS